jgi:hypothetical protein
VGRVINPEGAGKERLRLTRAVVLALRELMRQAEANEQTKDLAAFIALALEEVYATIETSVGAWEKRGYWIKADRFRMEWTWSERLGKAMREAVMTDNWPIVAVTAAQVAEKLKDIDLPQRHNLGTPWVGAWGRLAQTVKN